MYSLFAKCLMFYVCSQQELLKLLQVVIAVRFTLECCHMMAAGVPENVSEWSYERTLGSGGFGAVYLYRNKVC